MKKGQSLVEVMVAMFVMMVVFVSMATLIVQSLNLVVISRTRTVVTSIAQGAMSDSTMQIKSSCPVIALPAPSSPKTLGLTFPNPDPAKYTITAIAETLSAGDQPNNIVGITTPLPSNFYKVTVTITWRNDGEPSNSTYQLAQLVSRQ